MTPSNDSPKSPDESTGKPSVKPKKSADTTPAKALSPQQVRANHQQLNEALTSLMAKGIKVPLDSEPMP